MLYIPSIIDMSDAKAGRGSHNRLNHHARCAQIENDENTALTAMQVPTARSQVFGAPDFYISFLGVLSIGMCDAEGGEGSGSDLHAFKQM